MKTNYPLLFKPLTIRGITFKNRILTAPIGTWSLVPQDGLQETTLLYLAERATGGAASVGMGDTLITYGDPWVDKNEKVIALRGPEVRMAYLTEFADTIQQHGALATIELAHPGSTGGPSMDSQGTYGPVPRPGKHGVGLAMDEQKILHTLDCYGECCRTLKQAGFKMVTLHAAHTKLIDQFIQPSNNRSDKWGGCLENRLRFPHAVAERIRKEVGDDFIIEMRISGALPEEDPRGFEETVALVRSLEGLVDIFNVTHEPRNSPAAYELVRRGGTFDAFPFDGTSKMPGPLQSDAPNSRYATELKKAVSSSQVFIGAVGAIISPELAENILEESCDFVILGRPLNADPEFPSKARANRPEDIRPCLGCMKCLDGMHVSHVQRCAVNPRLSKEYYTRPGEKAPVSKNVAVIGGGVAGMQAALTAAERGHLVTLFEKNAELGGKLTSFEGVSEKRRLTMLRHWFITQLSKANVDIRLNTEATAEMITELNPDAVILAAGSVPKMPGFPVEDGSHILNILEAFEKTEELKGHIVVIGGGLSGLEFAVTMLRLGHQVTVVQAHPVKNGEMDYYLKGARIITNARCTSISKDNVSVRVDANTANVASMCSSDEADSDCLSIPYDTAVYATGMESRNGLETVLREEFCDFWNIGDSKKSASIYEAVHDGYYAALDI